MMSDILMVRGWKWVKSLHETFLLSQINSNNLVTFPHLVQFLTLWEMHHHIKHNPYDKLSESISSQIKKSFKWAFFIQMLLFFKDWHGVGKEPRTCKNSLLSLKKISFGQKSIKLKINTLFGAWNKAIPQTLIYVWYFDGWLPREPTTPQISSVRENLGT